MSISRNFILKTIFLVLFSVIFFSSCGSISNWNDSVMCNKEKENYFKNKGFYYERCMDCRKSNSPQQCENVFAHCDHELKSADWLTCSSKNKNNNKWR
jgi:hypothetical protein